MPAHTFHHLLQKKSNDTLQHTAWFVLEKKYLCSVVVRTLKAEGRALALSRCKAVAMSRLRKMQIILFFVFVTTMTKRDTNEDSETITQTELHILLLERAAAKGCSY